MEEVVAKVDEFEDGDMREVEVGDVTVLLVRLDGEFYAVGGECTHFGAPLADGVIHNGSVRCPWHQACFDATTGELEEPPALDALSKFKARVEDGKVVVSIPDEATNESLPEMAEKDPDRDDRTFVIIGGGAAGHSAAESLRQSGFQGEIKIITAEENPPYDRTQLSKYNMANNSNRLPVLRSREFYREVGIQLLTGKEVTGLEVDEKRVTFSDGQTVDYDRLLIATGANPNELPVPGKELKNVFTLREPEDLKKINQKAESSANVTIIGSSFIGMEAAASLSGRDLDVTVVSLSSTPFENVLGEKIGEVYQATHSENGVSFEMGSNVKSFNGNGAVEEVELANGKTIPSDFVIMGVGVTPATGFLEDSLNLNEDGGIPVDDRLRVTEDIYAAGDVAAFRDWRTDDEIRVEHWRLAQQQGRVAGKNMAGQATKFRSLPLFWTNQFDIYLRYVGYADDWDEIVFDGDPSSKEFIAYYVSDGEVVAIAGSNSNMEMAALAELMEEGQIPDPDEISSGGLDPVERLKGLRS